MGPRLQRLFPVLILLLAGLFLHARQLAGDPLFWRDTYALYAPAKFHLAQTLLAGELPQWQPWDGAGSPFLAQPQFSVFHPTTLLYLVAPFWQAFALQDLAGSWAALLGAYALGRTLRMNRRAALVAAVTFGACGYVVCLTEHTFMKLSAATLPWYCAALVVAGRRRGAWLAAPALAMGLLLLAGDPQIAILATLTGATLLLAERQDRTSLGLALFSPLAGALLGAVQILPSMLLAPETERVHALAEANKWHLELHHLAGLVFPLDHGEYDWLRSTYVGVAPLALALATWPFLRRRPRLGALWGLAGVSLWLSAGDGFGLNLAARHLLPFWDKLRYPLKSSVVAFLALAMLAGHGFMLVRHRVRGAQARRWALRGVTVAMLLALAASLTRLGATRPALDAGLTLVLALSLVAATAWVGRGRRELEAVAVVVVAALAVAGPLLETTGPGFYAPTGAVQAAKAQGVGLSGPYVELFDTGPPSARRQPLVTSELGVGVNLFGALHGLPVLQLYTPAASQRVRRVVFAPGLSVGGVLRAMGLFGVGAVWMSRPVPPALAADVVATDDRYDFALVRLRRSLGRAYLARRARAVPDPDTARLWLFGPSFAPGREITVETPVARPDWEARGNELSVPVALSPEARTNSSLALDVALPWDGFVVLNEAWFPGWTAEVDGASAPVLVANGCMRAVEVAAGSHRVVLRYRTPGLVAGALVSAVALGLLAAFALVLARRARKPAAAARAA